MERKHNHQGKPSQDYRCMHESHPGKVPSTWEVNHKCKPGEGECQALMTKEEYEQWCREHNTYFIGG